MSAKTDTAIKLTASLGVGLLPGAPGTYGSLATLGLAAAWLALGGGAFVGLGYWLGVLGLSALAVATSRAALARGVFGPSADPSAIVIDEAAGMLLALAWSDRLGWPLLMAFAAFRLFDIAKPWPVGWSQSLPGAWGVVVDDLLAGLYALAVTRLAVGWLGG